MKGKDKCITLCDFVKLNNQVMRNHYQQSNNNQSSKTQIHQNTINPSKSFKSLQLESSSSLGLETLLHFNNNESSLLSSIYHRKQVGNRSRSDQENDNRYEQIVNSAKNQIQEMKNKRQLMERKWKRNTDSLEIKVRNIDVAQRYSKDDEEQKLSLSNSVISVYAGKEEEGEEEEEEENKQNLIEQQSQNAKEQQSQNGNELSKQQQSNKQFIWPSMKKASSHLEKNRYHLQKQRNKSLVKKQQEDPFIKELKANILTRKIQKFIEQISRIFVKKYILNETQKYMKLMKFKKSKEIYKLSMYFNMWNHFVLIQNERISIMNTIRQKIKAKRTNILEKAQNLKFNP